MLSNKPFQDTYLVVDDFMPQADADAMRAAIEAHFANPAQHAPATHMIWRTRLVDRAAAQQQQLQLDCVLWLSARRPAAPSSARLLSAVSLV